MPESKNRATDRKVLSGTVGVLSAGHVADLLIWILAQFNYEMPMEVALSAVVVAAAAAQFFLGWKTQPEGTEQTLREANQAVELAETRSALDREKLLRTIQHLTGKTEEEIREAETANGLMNHKYEPETT